MTRVLLLILLLWGMLVVVFSQPNPSAATSAEPTQLEQEPAAIPASEQEKYWLLGGHTTIYNTTPNAFGQQAPGFPRQQQLLFFVGNSFFNQNWVTAPASTTARDGLGPLFNARSCASCHFKDGRGRPPEYAGETPTGFILRLGLRERNIHGNRMPDPHYGWQLQEHAIEGVPPEAAYTIEYEEIAGTYPDGTPYSLRKPSYTFNTLAYGELDPEITMSGRVANQIIGLGLLEAIPTARLEALADPTDQDGDGISGRYNWVWDTHNHRMAVGRFGWKAEQPSILQQVSAAFRNDMGITNTIDPHESCTGVQEACQQAPKGNNTPQEPEIIADDLLKVVLYSSSLAVPAQRDYASEDVQAGRLRFSQVGCTSCHVARHQTGIHPTLPSLSHQYIYPYTDLLLHDMGEGLADELIDFQATGSEWRTPPLWGIGLFETVNGHTYYLHDGRARGLEEAILWHGGEAQPANDAFQALPAEAREQLLAFLKSL